MITMMTITMKMITTLVAGGRGGWWRPRLAWSHHPRQPVNQKKSTRAESVWSVVIWLLFSRADFVRFRRIFRHFFLFLVPLSLFFLKKSNYQPVNHKMEGELSITTSFGHCLVLILVAAALCVIVIIFSISKILLTSGATNCDKKLQQARMADYQLHTTKPISATKVAASNFWRKSIQIPSSAIFSTFLLSVWRERRGREFAETFCFVTLTQATIVSVLFLPLLVPFAKETCQTCDNNKSHSYCHFLELFVGHAQQFRR